MGLWRSWRPPFRTGSRSVRPPSLPCWRRPPERSLWLRRRGRRPTSAGDRASPLPVCVLRAALPPRRRACAAERSRVRTRRSPARPHGSLPDVPCRPSSVIKSLQPQTYNIHMKHTHTWISTVAMPDFGFGRIEIKNLEHSGGGGFGVRIRSI